MARIIIYELYSTDSENFLTDLDEEDSKLIYGGDKYDLNKISQFTETIFEFVVIILAIDSIVELVKSYIVSSTK
ncbi:hypothetical protein H6G36_11885 [Anabaena minutissima FACHB-250]|uniref:hypothetical protein n=1 Tax=Anabaena sp. CCY 9402-a TaxID=3103867 RepID=UPI001689D399|nr:hypothetical protein [Anabaena minutissima FACHB-250]